MQLVIKGNDNKVKALAKELRLKLKRNHLASELIEDVKEEKVKKSVKDIVEEISKIEELEDLKQFETDDRKGVIKALEGKKQELEEKE